MNQIVAKVVEIESCDSLHIVAFESHGDILSMMSLELPDVIKVGVVVKLLVKSSHIAIGKDYSGEISYANQLKTIITSCENGELLSSVKLNFFDTELESIITKKSSQKMALKVGDTVIAFIKASELSIGEIVSD